MKIHEIKQYTGSSLSWIDITKEEIDTLKELEKKQIIFIDEDEITKGIFTDEYVNFVVCLFKKYNIPFSIEDLTSDYIDEILDKISAFGIDSLEEKEKLILNQIR